MPRGLRILAAMSLPSAVSRACRSIGLAWRTRGVVVTLALFATPGLFTTLGLCTTLLPGCHRNVCETGSCPVGQTCQPSTGVCKAGPAALAEPPGLFGHLALLRLPDGQLGIAGHAPSSQSLVLLTGRDDVWRTSVFAGPSARPDDPPAGSTFAAIADASGQIHLAWVGTDAVLQYATGSPAGWQREAVPLATQVGPDVAIGLWQGQPVVAWRALDPPGLRLAHRQDGAWTTEGVPAAPLPGQPTATVDEGHGLSLAMLSSGPALVSYEATGGDLILAVRTGTAWNVARIAGRDAVTGQDTGDAGATSALTVGPTGELAVAYRDRTSGRVMLARSKAGVVTQEVVATGLQTDAQTGTQRVDLVGTALAVALRPSGRAVVALQDASHARVELAIQSSSGTFTRTSLPGDGPQAWPALQTLADGSIAVAWVELRPALGPGAGQLRTLIVPPGGTP